MFYSLFEKWIFINFSFKKMFSTILIGPIMVISIKPRFLEFPKWHLSRIKKNEKKSWSLDKAELDFRNWRYAISFFSVGILAPVLLKNAFRQETKHLRQKSHFLFDIFNLNIVKTAEEGLQIYFRIIMESALNPVTGKPDLSLLMIKPPLKIKPLLHIGKYS